MADHRDLNFSAREKGHTYPPQIQPLAIVPPNAQEDKRSGPPANPFFGNAYKSSWAGPGPTRTEKTLTRRSEPYRSPHARQTEHQNGGVGPSTLPTLQPTGRSTTETMADAKSNQVITWGDNAPHQENHKYPRKHREGTLLRDLRGLVMKWKRYEKLPAQNDALLEVYNYVANVRQLVYDHPRLAQRSHKPKSLISSERKKVWEKKSTERYFFERLSQYYPLGEVGGNEDKAVWSRLSLLEALLEDLRVRLLPN